MNFLILVKVDICNARDLLILLLKVFLVVGHEILLAFPVIKLLAHQLLLMVKLQVLFMQLGVLLLALLQTPHQKLYEMEQFRIALILIATYENSQAFYRSFLRGFAPR